MKKLFISFQWMVLFALIAFGAFTLLRSNPPVERNPTEWNNWQGFSVLSYAGVMRNAEPPYISPDQLRKQLESLKQAGYQTIIPEDALAYLQEHQALPDKALLLIFEGGRKDSLLYSSPVLRELGYSATMAVPTSLTHEWGNFYLKVNEIRRINSKPNWNIANMGHDAHRMLNANASGSIQGHFLTTQAWFNGQQESEEEYAARVQRDFEESSNVLEKYTKGAVPAYIVPFSDLGDADSAAPAALNVIAKALTSVHQLAFVGGGDPFNGSDANPYALNRLRVPAEWSTEDLLKSLKISGGRDEGITELTSTSDWLFDGVAELADNDLLLASNSRAWLRGTALWSDQQLEVSLSKTPGATAAIYLRYAGPLNYLRIVLTDTTLRVQERLGRRMQTLALLDYMPAQENYTFSIKLRGNRAWVSLDGNEIGGTLPLTAITSQGRTGFESRGGSARITSIDAQPSKSNVVVLDSDQDLDKKTLADTTAVIIPWGSDNWSKRVLRRAAVGIETIPLLATVEKITDEEQRELAAEVSASLNTIVLQPLIHQVTVPDGLPILETELRQAGYVVIRSLPAATAMEKVLTDEQAPDIHYLIHSENPQQTYAVIAKLLHTIPAQRFIADLPEESVNAPPGVRISKHINSPVSEAAL